MGYFYAVHSLAGLSWGRYVFYICQLLPAQRPELEVRGAKEKQGLLCEPKGSLCKIFSRGLGCSDSGIECVDLITENSAEVGVDSGLACTVCLHACHACQLPQTGRDLCLHLGQEGTSTYRQAGGRKLPSTPQQPSQSETAAVQPTGSLHWTPSSPNSLVITARPNSPFSL